MKSILQGTTPTIVFNFENSGLAVADIDAAELTITSKNEKITHALSDMTVDTTNNKLSYHFTEAETLKLNAVTNAYYQLYINIDGEIYGTVKALCGIYVDIKGTVMSSAS